MMKVEMIVKETRALLEDRSPKAAEEYLLTIADKEGDEALAPILEQLTPLEWAEMLRFGTVYDPSVFGEILTPKQIAEAVLTEPLHWKVKEYGIDNLSAISAEVYSLLLSILEGKSDARRLAIINAIVEDEGGIFLLTIPFADIGNIFESDASDDDGTSSVAIPVMTDKLFSFISESVPEVAERIVAILQNRSFGFIGEEWQAMSRFINEVLEQAEARISEAEEATVTGEDVSSEMFRSF
jgi:hypothetical protein